MKYKIEITSMRKEILREEYFDTEEKAWEKLEELNLIRRPLSYMYHDMNLCEYGPDQPPLDNCIGSVRLVVIDQNKQRGIKAELIRNLN